MAGNITESRNIGTAALGGLLVVLCSVTVWLSRSLFNVNLKAWWTLGQYPTT